jgi:hypothetical protein
MIDMYTHNFAYVGTRATGTGAGSYLIAGPGWAGAVPPGISAVLQSEGNFVYALGRTAVAGPDDVENVLAIQAQYQLQPLSAFLGQPPPPDAAIAFPAFDQAAADSIGFIGYFNFLLGQLAVHPSEQALIASFAPIGIGPYAPFDPDAYDAATRGGIEEGIASARQQIAAHLPELGEMKNGWLLLKRIFGSRAEMQGQYLTRAAAAQAGLFGNSLDEAYYPSTQATAEGRPLDGAQHDYTLTFTAETLPPVNAFWSITMYKLPQQLMVANPLDRYSIGDRTPGLVYGENGSLTLCIQAAAPIDPDQQANWLPAPDGPFALTMRMYVPRPEALDPLYAPPALEVTAWRVRLPLVALQGDGEAR